MAKRKEKFPLPTVLNAACGRIVLPDDTDNHLALMAFMTGQSGHDLLQVAAVCRESLLNQFSHFDSDEMAEAMRELDMALEVAGDHAEEARVQWLCNLQSGRNGFLLSLCGKNGDKLKVAKML